MVKIIYFPKFIMGDGADAITNALSSVFGGNCTRLMYFYATQNVKKNSKLKNVSIEFHKIVKNKVAQLHRVINSNKFYKGF